MDEVAKYRVGNLRDPRPRAANPSLWYGLMVFSVVTRILAVMRAQSIDLFSVDNQPFLWLIQAEMVVTVLLFGCFARWADQGHWITFWQVMYTVEVIVVRQALFDNVWMLSLAFVGLYATYFVGVYCEFTKWEMHRIPPFCPKNQDKDRPKYGWLGRSIGRRVRSKCGRIVITAFLYCSGLAFGFFMMYAFLFSEIDNLRHLPTYKNGDKNSNSLLSLLIVGVVASCLSMIPAMLVEAGAVPGLVSDWWNMKKASRSYRTGIWDICELDEDKDGPGPELKKILQTKLKDVTIVLPCYLPNEVEILPFVFQHYLEQFEKLAEYEGAEKCVKAILLVWNAPDKWQKEEKPPAFDDDMKQWKEKFEASGFVLDIYDNPHSTSKCDNLNLACDLIKTETCCLNDADTMLDWTCLARGSNHIRNGYDIAQAMNSHCYNDCRGRPGDDSAGEGLECHPYGILITIGDATKPQNMSTQTPFKHAPFNGRGGFWKTESLQKVGFDHRTVGEDHDAGYRGCAYYGMKGILDMNMLCQEQEPPDCKALTSQRIRWETAALEMRRTFSWILRSKHYGRFETFVLLWGQLQQNCNLPLQALPFQVATALPLIILKGWLSIYAFGPIDSSKEQLCARDDCVWEFPITNPWNGSQWNVAVPLPLVIFIGCGVVFIAVNAFDFLVRVCTTRYNPRLMFFIYYGLLKPLLVAPYFMWVQYWALFDYCWGGAKFIATARSPVSPKSQQQSSGGLSQPLNQK